MKITPLDLRRQEFNRKVRGFDPDEVGAFLEDVANEYEAAIRENASLKEQIERLDAQVVSFRELEKTLQDTLVSAQKAREEAKSDASKEAECIIREAELKAERWIEEARQEVAALKRELSTLRNHKASFIAKMGALLSSQNELLNLMQFDSEERQQSEIPSSSDAGRRNHVGGSSAGEGTPSPGSQQSEVQSPNGQQGETNPSPDSGAADGQRRPIRRFYRGRNPQGEGESPTGEG